MCQLSPSATASVPDACYVRQQFIGIRVQSLLGDILDNSVSVN